MQRPTLLLKNTTLTWVMRLYDASDALVNADSTPTVAVRKNGSSTGDSVTVTKRPGTTGIYDCSYNPDGEIEGDQFTIEETSTVSGMTTSWNWSFVVLDSDVTGKVLGGGSGTISGTGARVALASDGLDSVSITAPSGVASNFREMIVQVWRRFFKKATQTDSQIKTYDDDGSTVVTTQTVSDDGTTETQGAAS